MKYALRTTLKILAGLVVATIASFTIEFAVDPLLLRLFPNALPNEAAISFNLWAGLFTMTYSLACITLGGYVTARLSKYAGVRDAIIMGLVQTALFIPAYLQFGGDKAPSRNFILGMILATPAAWLGGWLHSWEHVDSIRQNAAGSGVRSLAS